MQQEFDTADADADDDQPVVDKPKRGKGAAKKSRVQPAQEALPSKPIAHAWPKDLAEQTRAVRGVLNAVGRVMPAAEVAKFFKNAKTPRVEEILATLVALGHARRTDAGYSPA